MFERIGGSPSQTVTVFVDGSPVMARPTDTVAVALLAANLLSLRINAADGTPRAPYCLMGVCHDCRIAVDGTTGVQACITPVRDGMRIVLGRAATDD